MIWELVGDPQKTACYKDSLEMPQGPHEENGEQQKDSILIFKMWRLEREPRG